LAEVVIAELETVIRRRPVNGEIRLARGIEAHRHESRRLVRHQPDKLRRKPQLPGPRHSPPPSFVVADGAEEHHFVPQPPRVGREVEWRATETFRLPEAVPQDLSDAHNSHDSLAGLLSSVVHQ